MRGWTGEASEITFAWCSLEMRKTVRYIFLDNNDYEYYIYSKEMSYVHVIHMHMCVCVCMLLFNILNISMVMNSKI